MVLVGYWPLNEETGDTAYDYSGNENHGNLNDPNLGVSGPLGGMSYEFDGNSDTVELPNGSLSFLREGSFTWCGWIYPYYIEDRHVLMAYESSEGVDIEVLNGGSLRITEHFNDSAATDPIINTNEWSFVAVRNINDRNRVIFTINGINYARDWDTDPSLGGNSNSRLGESLSRSDRHYEGRFCEMRVYSRLLTDSEIQYIYNVSKRGRFTSRKKKARKTE